MSPTGVRYIVKKLLSLATLALLATLGCDAEVRDVGRATAALEARDGNTLHETLVIERGREPGQVSLRPADVEVVAAGPGGFAISAAGAIAVADTLADRIVRFDRQGRPLEPLDAPAVEQVIYDEHGALHAWSRRDNAVTSFDPAGQETSRIELPSTMRWITGLHLSPTGGPSLHTAHQESVPVDAQTPQRSLVEGVTGFDGQRYRTIRRPGSAYIEIFDTETATTQPLRGRHLDVAVGNSQGSVTFVGASEEGEIVVDVQEVVSSDPIRVQRSLRRYASTGELVAERSIPRGDIVVPHRFSMLADGTVALMTVFEDHVEVQRWQPSAGGAR